MSHPLANCGEAAFQERLQPAAEIDTTVQSEVMPPPLPFSDRMDLQSHRTSTRPLFNIYTHRQVRNEHLKPATLKSVLFRNGKQTSLQIILHVFNNLDRCG